MNLALLLPAGLTALAAVVLPLLIHLARRSEQRPVDFAALRWLRQKPKPRQRIRFDEWPLLIVRLLLLIVLALLLARPVLFGAADTDPWVVVVPGADAARVRAQPIPAKARVHWLARGFPRFDAGPGRAAPPRTSASISSLLRELDATLPQGVALTVLVPATLDGVDAQRPILSRRIDWRVLPGSMPATVASARDLAPRLSVRYTPDREAAVRYLRAVDAAWHEPAAASTPDIAPVAQPLQPTARQLAWLAPGALPQGVRDWLRAGGTALLDAQTTLPNAAPMVPLWKDDAGTVLVEGAAYGKGRVMRLTRPLAPQALPQLLDGDFPQRLRDLFVSPVAEPARVVAAEFAPMTGGAVYATAPRDLQPWLLALIALLYALERWMATGRRHGGGP